MKYRFEELTDRDGWQFIGFDSGEGDGAARDAFERISIHKELGPGSYRFQRVDESDSPDWGHVVLTEDDTTVFELE